MVYGLGLITYQKQQRLSCQYMVRFHAAGKTNERHVLLSKAEGMIVVAINKVVCY